MSDELTICDPLACGRLRSELENLKKAIRSYHWYASMEWDYPPFSFLREMSEGVNADEHEVAEAKILLGALENDK